MIMRNLGIAAPRVALAGCASSAADITPSYVSPVMYQPYACQQLALEAQGVSASAAALSGAQDSQHTKDAGSDNGRCDHFLAGGILGWRRQANGGRARPDERSVGRD